MEQKKSLIPLKDAVDDAIKQTQDVERGAAVGDTTGIHLGFDKLDRALPVIRPGNLISVAACSDILTAFALNVVINNPEAGILIAAFEMNAREIAARMLCMLSKEPMSNLLSGRIENWSHVLAAEMVLSRRPIEVLDEQIITPESLAAAIDEYTETHGKAPDLVVVDDLPLMSLNGGRSLTQEEAMDRFVRRLKLIARGKKVAILLLSELNNASVKPVKGKSSIPELSELRETEAIELYSDVVILLWEDADSTEDMDARLINAKIAKSRNGKRGIVEQICFYSPTQRMWSRDEWPEAPVDTTK